MAEDNVEVVRAMIEAFNARDRDTVLALADPDVEFRSAVEDRVYRGHAGLVQYRDDVETLWEGWRIEDNRFIDAGGDRVVHLYCVVGQGIGSGVAVTRAFATLWQLRDGKLLKGEVYLDPQQALADAGVSEG